MHIILQYSFIVWEILFHVVNLVILDYIFFFWFQWNELKGFPTTQAAYSRFHGFFSKFCSKERKKNFLRLNMATVLIYFYTKNSLHDFKLFTRKLYPSRFESDSRIEYNEETQRLFLVLSQVKHSPATSLFDCTPELCTGNENGNTSSKDDLERNSKAKPGILKCCYLKRHQMPRQESYFQLCPIHQMCLTLDSHVASCAAHELALSRIFRKKFLKYAKSKVGLSHSFNNVDDHEDVKLVWIPFVIEIQLEYPKQKIDYSWWVIFIKSTNFIL